jgi:hypothetical protein
MIVTTTETVLLSLWIVHFVDDSPLRGKSGEAFDVGLPSGEQGG